MIFKSLEITNFRSFGPDTVTIEFDNTENLLVLIGANNAGKSNLVEAIRLVLAPPRYFKPSASDFFNSDITQEIKIVLHLREPLKRENIYHKEDIVTGFFFRVWLKQGGSDRGHLSYQHYCLNDKGGTYIPPATVPGKKQLQEDAEAIQPKPKRASEVIPQLCSIHFLDPELQEAFRTTGYGVLARLLDIYRDDFRDEGNTFDVKGDGTQIVPSAKAFERLAVKMREILKTDKFNEIEKGLNKNLLGILGPEGQSTQLSLGFPTPEQLLGAMLSLEIKDDPARPPLPLDRLGSGYRSILRLAIIRTYREISDDKRIGTFLVEEPEVYLHPHLRRYFHKTLKELADAGNQVIVTTHDSSFVELPEYKTVGRVAKKPTSTFFRTAEPLDFSYERVSTKLSGSNNNEILFAHSVVLTEGQTDQAVVRGLLERDGYDLDSHSVSVANCGSRNNLPDYIKLLKALDISFYALADGDKSTVAIQPQLQSQIDKITNMTNGNHFLFSEDLEHALGTTKQSSNNLQHVLEVFEKLDMSKLPTEINELLQKLKGFLP